MGLKDLLQRTTKAAKAAAQRGASAQQDSGGDGWTDGWHTRASTAEVLAQATKVTGVAALGAATFFLKSPRQRDFERALRNHETHLREQRGKSL